MSAKSWRCEYEVNEDFAWHLYAVMIHSRKELREWMKKTLKSKNKRIYKILSN